MQKIVVEYYSVTCPDGGGQYNETVAMFVHKHQAEEVAVQLSKEKNWPHSVSTNMVDEYELYESAREFFLEHQSNQIRKRALAKLTDEEKIALGVK